MSIVEEANIHSLAAGFEKRRVIPTSSINAITNHLLPGGQGLGGQGSCWQPPTQAGLPG